MAGHLADASSSLHLSLSRVMAALWMGRPYEARVEWDATARMSIVIVSTRIADRDQVDGTFDSLEAAFMQELQDEDTPRTVQRPSGLQVNVGGVNNLQVKWDRENGCYRLTSICVICGRAFERTLRGFVTKDLITAAHDLGYTLGEHAERHRSFGEHLRELQQKEENTQHSK